jgi:hypothetical protein
LNKKKKKKKKTNKRIKLKGIKARTGLEKMHP